MLALLQELWTAAKQVVLRIWLFFLPFSCRPTRWSLFPLDLCFCFSPPTVFHPTPPSTHLCLAYNLISLLDPRSASEASPPGCPALIDRECALLSASSMSRQEKLVSLSLLSGARRRGGPTTYVAATARAFRHRRAAERSLVFYSAGAEAWNG